MERREILFSAKAVEDGRWVEGYFVMRPESVEDEYKAYIYQDFCGSFDSQEIVEVDRDTVCQFTGLQDIKGVEIYESDIMGDENGERYTVEYENGTFCLVESGTRSRFRISQEIVDKLGLCCVDNIFDKEEKQKGKEMMEKCSLLKETDIGYNNMKMENETTKKVDEMIRKVDELLSRIDKIREGKL